VSSWGAGQRLLAGVLSRQLYKRLCIFLAAPGLLQISNPKGLGGPFSESGKFEEGTSCSPLLLSLSLLKIPL
jgi:hypothetical protein